MNWRSPYQTAPFHEALVQAGVPSRAWKLAGETMFANMLASSRWTAWEVDSPKEVASLVCCDVWRYAGRGDYDQHQWGSEADSCDSYYTLVVASGSDFRASYSSSCMRNVRTAARYHLTHEGGSAALVAGVKALSVFRARPQTRGGLPFPLFRSLVFALLDNGVADVHVVLGPNGDLCATAVVLTTGTHANLRFVAAFPDALPRRPVNFLYDQVIAHYLASNYECVDLSGVVAPNAAGKKLAGINRFKLGFSRSLVWFEREWRPCQGGS